MAIEKTLIIFKPDCMLKGLYGEILTRFSKAGLFLVGCKMVRLSDDILREHYAHIADRPFYPKLEAYMSSYPVMIAVLSGEHAVARVRKLIGPTDSVEAPAGTIRGDMGIDKGTNVIHGSDSVEAAQAEISRFFRSHEMYGHAEVTPL